MHNALVDKELKELREEINRLSPNNTLTEEDFAKAVPELWAMAKKEFHASLGVLPVTSKSSRELGKQRGRKRAR